MALTSNLTIDWGAVLTKAGDLGNPSVSIAKRVAMALTSGVIANTADTIFADTRTIAPSTTDTLDLVGGGLLTPLGDAFAPVKLKGLLVVAAGANVNNVQVTRPAANGVPLFLAVSDGIPVLPGGYFAWASPNLASIAIAAGTADLIAIINGGAGTSVDYDIVIVGTTA